MSKQEIDYSVYLVTDSNLVSEHCEFLSHVEKAIQGGVTIVQLREKNLDTNEFIKRATELHEITAKYGVPLIINDRIDVAIAMNAEGVHIGVDDMDPVLARKLLGDEKILGYSVRNMQEYEFAYRNQMAAKIDYIGIGAVYDTKTKAVKVKPLQISGAKEIIQLHQNFGWNMKTVLIGGINEKCIDSVLSGTAVLLSNEQGFRTHKTVDGLAFVSDIMTAIDPKRQVEKLALQIFEAKHKLSNIPSFMESKKSLTHFITNSVVQNFSANVCIAIGGSPIMSQFQPEFEDLSKIDGSGLVLNMGTPEINSLDKYVSAIRHYIENDGIIVFDPVGCSATSARQELAASIKMALSSSSTSNIIFKGNMAEIFHIAGIKGKPMHGVDSDKSIDIWNHQDELTQFVRTTGAHLVITGKTDHVITFDSNSNLVNWYTVEGGDQMMARVTGSGCALGGVIARYASSSPRNKLSDAIIYAVALYKESGARAIKVSQGPGTFAQKFIDTLFMLSESDKAKIFENTQIWFKSLPLHSTTSGKKV